MHKGLTMATAVAGLMMVSSAATAGGYVSFGFGSTSYTEAGTILDAAYDIEIGDTGYKFAGGFMFSDNFGVEVARYSLVDMSWLIGDLTMDVGLTALAGFAVAKFPIHQDLISVVGKAGMLRWDLEGSASDGVDTAALADDGTDFMWGVGAEFKVDETLSIVAEWESIVWDEPAGVETSTNYYGVTLHYNF